MCERERNFDGDRREQVLAQNRLLERQSVRNERQGLLGLDVEYVIVYECVWWRVDWFSRSGIDLINRLAIAKCVPNFLFSSCFFVPCART